MRDKNTKEKDAALCKREWRFLINIIVQPVGVEKVGGAAP
jgi:hypothetical protein